MAAQLLNNLDLRSAVLGHRRLELHYYKLVEWNPLIAVGHLYEPVEGDQQAGRILLKRDLSCVDKLVL